MNLNQYQSYKQAFYKIKHHRSGFTLIETLVVLSVLGLVIVAAMSIFVSMNQIRIKSKALTGIRELGSSTLQFLSKNIRNATDVRQESGNLIITTISGDEITVSCLVGNYLQFSSGAQTQNLVTQTSSLHLDTCSLTLTPATPTEPAVSTVSFSLSMPGIVDTAEVFSNNIVVRNTRQD